MPLPSIISSPALVGRARRIIKPDLRTHKAFQSNELDNERDLIVYLPPGYRRNATQRYPVLYMQDGQNLFDPQTAFIPGVHWRVGETADELITSRRIEPLIIVGLYNTGDNRINEYTPTRDPKLGGGLAEFYRRMLIREVLPFIESKYHISRGPAYTALGGSSLGALVSLYVGLRSPAVFGKLAVMAPSVWGGGGAILNTRENGKGRRRPKIWLDIGTEEGRKALRDARRLRRALQFEGWAEGQNLAYSEVRGGKHSEEDWAKRVGQVLEYLFPAK